MNIPHYPNLGSAMRSICSEWCAVNGYSDPFCRDGEWWAFPPNGVIPVRIKAVMGEGCQQLVKIGSLTLTIFPDGSLASGT